MMLAPWIIFGAGISVICLRLIAGKRARRAATRPRPPPRTDSEASADVADGPDRRSERPAFDPHYPHIHSGRPQVPAAHAAGAAPGEQDARDE